MEKLIIIKTLNQLQGLVEHLKDKEYLSYDTETTGVDRSSEIIGFSVCADVEIGYYVVLSYWEPIEKRLVEVIPKEVAKQFIKDNLVGKSLIMHNAVFDCMITNAFFGIELMPYVHTDTMILAHLLDENRLVGLKELGVSIFGADARKEQIEMKESVYKNGGVLTKENYELYKADCDLMAKYGAKDAILTLKLFYILVPDLFEQGLDVFFYEEESMPLLRGPTYQLNTTGLKVDVEKLQKLKVELEAECLELKAFIYKEIDAHVKHKYKGTTKTNTFNIGASKQLAWLLYSKLGNEFHALTKGGRELCKGLELKLPYSPAAKREFIRVCIENKGKVYAPAAYNPKTKKMGRPKVVGDPWNYMACGKEALGKVAHRYKWVDALLKYAKNLKLLNTYVIGIQERMKYGIIHPSFLQHGTTSGRYSSKAPNFQNLPRKDKRIKSCMIARPGKVFVGADYSQLEPRVFASFSKDQRLMNSFKSGDDIYSVIGMEVFDKYDCVPQKEGRDNAFGVKYPDERDAAKVVMLSATYGTTAPKMAPTIKKSIEEAQETINTYFERFPSVQKLMLESHEMAKNDGKVVNLFGRPRRMPKALTIKKIYGNTPHAELPYEIRNILNLAVNHRIQSSGASIMNRAAIALGHKIQAAGIEDAPICLQVHDEMIVECEEADAQVVLELMKDAMENTVTLPGVDLVAEPKIAKNLADLK